MTWTDEELHLFAQSLFSKSGRLERARLVRAEMLAGDASTRRFVRLHLSGAPLSTVVLMLLTGATGPVGGGERGLTQDDTFVEMQAYLSRHGVRVPELYLDARNRKALLVEDIGDTGLWHMAKGGQPAEVERLSDLVSGDPLLRYFERAVDVIGQLQSLPPDPKCIAFQRRPGFESYRPEVAELLHHVLEPRGIRRPERECLERVFDAVCESLCSHPAVLAHFDFMAHNIAVLPDGKLVLLDFQDACTVSPVRDVVALLNDRDMDSALGQERHGKLLEYYLRTVVAREPARELEAFPARYNEYLLHWDCRVSGRFALLAEQRGRPHYAEWIPGTLRRLGRTLLRVEPDFPGVDDLLTILPAYLPEVGEGIDDPWSLPPLPIQKAEPLTGG